MARTVTFVHPQGSFLLDLADTDTIESLLEQASSISGRPRKSSWVLRVDRPPYDSYVCTVIAGKDKTGLDILANVLNMDIREGDTVTVWDAP